jgi:hypothetical protein
MGAGRDGAHVYERRETCTPCSAVAPRPSYCCVAGSLAAYKKALGVHAAKDAEVAKERAALVGLATVGP